MDAIYKLELREWYYKDNYSEDSEGRRPYNAATKEFINTVYYLDLSKILEVRLTDYTINVFFQLQEKEFHYPRRLDSLKSDRYDAFLKLLHNWKVFQNK